MNFNGEYYITKFEALTRREGEVGCNPTINNLFLKSIGDYCQIDVKI